MWLAVLFCVRLRGLMISAYLKRISGVLKKDLSKNDFKRRATYCYVGDKPLDDMLYRETCKWDCYICGEVFESSKEKVMKGGWHSGCAHGINNQLKTRTKLTLEEVDARCKRCWLEERNDKPFTPHERGFGQRVKYWYHCDVCNHEFQLAYDGMFRSGIWCSYCSPTYKKLCGDVHCKWCWDNSVACNLDKYNLEWVASNNKEAHHVTKASSTKYNFKCLTCNHVIELPPDKIECKGVDSCCKYCTHQTLCSDDSCEMCKLNSASVYLKRTDMSIISNTPTELRTIFRTACVRVTCQCSVNNDHTWDVSLNNLAKRGCPYCKCKTESIIKNELIKHFPKLKPQARFEWCKNQRCLPFDFSLGNDTHILIENDGAQHYKDVPLFNKKMSLDEIRQRDNYKTKCALDNQYSVIRLVQQNVFADWEKGSTDWVDSLLEAIESIRVSPTPLSYGYAY